MEYITLKNGVSVPKLGLGTWYLGEKLSSREEEIRARVWHLSRRPRDLY